MLKSNITRSPCLEYTRPAELLTNSTLYLVDLFVKETLVSLYPYQWKKEEEAKRRKRKRKNRNKRDKRGKLEIIGLNQNNKQQNVNEKKK